MKDLRHLDPALRETLRGTLLDPSTLTLRPEVLQTAIVVLDPYDIKRLVTWQKCLEPTPANDHTRRQMNRVADARQYRRSVLPGWRKFRKVDFGDGLALLFAVDHPAVNAFMRRVMPATGVHEPELVAYLRQTVGRGDLVVDIGAHAGYVNGIHDTFTLLSRIEDTIHVNVKKLYPDASLPTITVEDNGDGSMEVYYSSKSGFCHVCHGLIEGCIEHFEENIAIQRVDTSAGPLDETARFLLTRN